MSFAYTSYNPTSINFYGNSVAAHELNYDNFDSLIGDLKQIVGPNLDIVDVNYTNGLWSATYADIPGITSFIANWTPDGLMSQAADYHSVGYGAIDQGIGEVDDQTLYFGVMYEPPAYMSDPLYTSKQIQTHNFVVSMSEEIGNTRVG